MYRLSECIGREAVVLAWFPKAFTSGCTTECRALQSSLRGLQALHARCFAVSTDSYETSRTFARALELEYPILSDPDRRVARAYGVLGPSGYPSRWTFVIGADGRIAAIDRNVKVQSHGRDLEARLQSDSLL
jgi:peroxiredoxin Q/BCP